MHSVCGQGLLSACARALPSSLGFARNHQVTLCSAWIFLLWVFGLELGGAQQPVGNYSVSLVSDSACFSAAVTGTPLLLKGPWSSFQLTLGGPALHGSHFMVQSCRPCVGVGVGFSSSPAFSPKTDRGTVRCQLHAFPSVCLHTSLAVAEDFEGKFISELIMVIISQYTPVSNHHLMCLQLTCYMSVISQ